MQRKSVFLAPVAGPARRRPTGARGRRSPARIRSRVWSRASDTPTNPFGGCGALTGVPACGFDRQLLWGLVCQALLGGARGHVCTHAGVACPKHLADLRLGYEEGSSQCSNKLLSVADASVRHHMQHTRRVRWQTPVIGAPHLWGRSRCGDPLPVRARRPSFMLLMMRYWPSRELQWRLSRSDCHRLEHRAGWDLAMLEVAP
jgi:hypothetical protein